MSSPAEQGLQFVERCAGSDAATAAADFLATIRGMGFSCAACGAWAGIGRHRQSRFFFVDWPADWLDFYERNRWFEHDILPIEARRRLSPFWYADVVPRLKLSSFENRKKAVELRKHLASVRYFGQELELVLSDAIEIAAKWFRPPSVYVLSLADLDEIVRSTLNMFLKPENISGTRFDVYSDNFSWSKAFTIPENDVVELCERQNVESASWLTGIWGLKVIDLREHIVRRQVIPAIIWEYLRLKYERPERKPREEAVFGDILSLSVGLR